MAKAEGPEEFFSALRSARKVPQPAPEKIIKVGPRSERPGLFDAKGSPRPDSATDSASASPTEPAVATETAAPEKPAPVTVHKGFTKPTPSMTAPTTESEPVVTMRVSTLIFAIILALVLMFIAYAVGRRVAFNASRQPAARTINTSGVEETRTPTLPDELRGKYGLFVRDFNPTESAGLANARAYQAFLNSDPQAGFIRNAGKKAFILSISTKDLRRLSVCVGPFDGINTPQINDVLAKLKDLKYNGVRQFNQAEAMPFPVFSKVLTDESRRSQ